MIVYIYGEDNFRSSVYLKQMVDRFKKERDPQGLNIVVLDGQKEEPTKLWQEISASPFLAERRMVVVKNLLSTKNIDILEFLSDSIKNKKVPENNILVIWQGEAVGKTKIAQALHKLLAVEKWAREFKQLEQREVNSWIKEEITNRGGIIGQAAVSYLAQNAGSDMWYLNSLLDQLVSFSVGKEISLANAQLFLDEKIDDNIFNMVDAVVSGNKKLAFKLLNKQRTAGMEESYIFSMITRQFRILVEMRDLYNREDNLPSEAMAKTLGVHPFVIKKSLAMMKKYSFDHLKNIYQELLDIDLKTKTGLGDRSLLIDLFVGKS